MVMFEERQIAPLREQRGSREITVREEGLLEILQPLFPAPVGVPEEELYELAVTTWQRFEAPRREMDLTGVVPLGVGLALKEPRGYERPDGDYIAYPAAQEPWVQAGQFFLPFEEEERLQGIADLGIDPDDMYVIHQTPPGTLRQYGLHDIPPAVLGPPPSRRTVAAAQDLVERARRANGPGNLTGPAVAGGIAVGAAALGLAATVGVVGLTLAALGSVAVGLDPIILGAVSTRPQPRPGDPVFLYLLSVYVWQEEGYHVIHATP
jgi:hypothetical protein